MKGIRQAVAGGGIVTRSHFPQKRTIDVYPSPVVRLNNPSITADSCTVWGGRNAGFDFVTGAENLPGVGDSEPGNMAIGDIVGLEKYLIALH